ncbi:uncharacterized protein V1516DRAFT_165241 [Lipomyces oligophaga]|uniref:uncharacterized protein n=1 Tax=Lipomyces oligophaga TaxID=45792 RepID=UPI0034CD701D
MKFGKYLAKRQLELPEYANSFINYKALKKLIKSLGNDPHNNVGQRPQDIQAALQAHKVTFFFRLERELDKVNAFYLQKEAELKIRLAALLEKKETAKAKLGTVVKTSATFVALHEGFFRFRRDLDKLEQFVELNATGFSKVLKKWDKRSKSHTKELYLSTAVEVQPVFHREEIAELSDLATTSLLELEAWADGEVVSFDHKLSDNSSIERTTEELDLDFLKTVSRESESSIREWIQRLQQAPNAGDRITRIFLLSITSNVSDDILRVLYNTNMVDLSAKDDVNDRTAFHEAAIAGRNVVLDLLIQHAAKIRFDASVTDIYGRTPLHYACIHGQSQMIGPLLVAGSPIDALDQDNYTALLFAISQKHATCVELLLSSGACVDPPSEQSYIPLSVACQRGLYSITELLLKSKATIMPDAEGLYPQHLIAQAGHSSLIQLLKDYGADINTVDKLNGWIALFYAASEGHPTTVKALIDAGADISFVDQKGLSPLYYATWEGHLDCIQLLMDAQTALEQRNGDSTDSRSFDGTFPMSDVSSDPTIETTYTSSNRLVFESAMELDSDIADVEGIPDLSLPPPILPLRRYGHNFLDKKTFVEIVFELPSSLEALVSQRPIGMAMPIATSSVRASPSLHTSSPSIVAMSSGSDTSPSSVRSHPQSAIQFYSNIPAAKLTVSSKLLDVIPRSLLLPLADDSRTLSFQIDDLDEFIIDFEVFPTFGSRIIAKSTALPHIFKASNGTGQCTLPLFDLRLQVIGDLTFKFNIIKPYQGTPLEITNFDVYWKSTSQVEPTVPQALIPSSLASVIGSSSVNSVSEGFTDSALSGSTVVNNALLSTNIVSSASSSFNPRHPQPTQVHALVTASSLSGSYARIFVQLTRDGIPVVFPYWTIDVYGFKVPLCTITFEEFQQLGRKLYPERALRRDLVCAATEPSSVSEVLYLSFLSLADALELLKLEVNLDLSIIYPTDVEKTYLNVASSMAGLNAFVDRILDIIFDHARKARKRTSAAARAAAAAGTPEIQRNRSLTFSSHHPNVCTVLNWKQPNYPVFFCIDISESAPSGELRFTSAHDLPVTEVEDHRCSSLREATTFASSNNLMGLICCSRLLNIVPALIESIRVSGLVLVAENSQYEQYTGTTTGVDGLRDAKVLEFNETIDM